MDIRLHIHQWLLGLAFLVLMHQCETSSGSSSYRICPQGQLFHRQNARLGRRYATCCYPTRCGVGEEVKPCLVNGTRDACVACGSHYNQSQRTSSFTMEKRCISWPLDENCDNKYGKKDFDDWKTRLCLCELERGLKFLLPESWKGAPKRAFCQPMKKCNPGFEPTVNGTCRPCEHGYFKATKSHSLCEPKTDCYLLGLDLISTLSGKTADNNCSEPVVFTTPKPVPPTVKVPVVDPGIAPSPRHPGSTVGSALQPTTTGTVRSGSSRSISDSDDQESGSLLWPIIAAVIFLIVVVVVIAIVLFYRKRKGMSICSCARFKSTDVEKYPTGVGHSQFKNGSGNGVPMEPQVLVASKGVNNNINGGLPQHHNSNHRQHAQHNGNIVHFSEGNDFDSQVFQNQKNSYQTRMSPTSRPGILRNGGDHPRPVLYSQFSNSRPQDASIDSIGREKLHVNANGFEANQDLGENDPLLVAEGPRTGTVPGHDLLHNTTYAASNSPPLLISSVNPGGMYPSSGASGHPNIQTAPKVSHSVGNMNPNFNNSSGNSSPVPVLTSQPTHQVTFAPTADTVTFKRSISVIASPEGEVEEEELEANVPRFSQILPDGEDPPSVQEPNPILRMLHVKDNLPMDSPQREVTHQMRLPTERLQHKPHQNPTNTTQQRNHNFPHQGFPPALFRASSQPASSENIPDHCIMDLKEQQLANSLTSSLDESSLPGTRHNTGSDLSHTNVLKLEDFTGSPDQTNVKVCTGGNKEFPGGAKNSKVPGMFTIGTSGSAQNTLERKRSGNNSLQRRRFFSGSNRQNSLERKRRSSGSESTHNTLDLKGSGDKQKSCLKNFGLEDGETEGKKLRLGRTVSFDAEEEKTPDSVGHDTTPKQVGDSLSSSESSQGHYADTTVDLRKEPRVTEEYYDGENDTDGEDTDPKQRQSDLDLSSFEDGQASPGANTYRRCQSESASSSTEAMQKPPPRSLSEEKPLKMERPIAKVKPMPTSDNSVNSLVVAEAAGDEDTTAPTANATSGTGNILDYSSESSSSEENIPREAQRRDRNGEEVNDSDDEDGRQ